MALAIESAGPLAHPAEVGAWLEGIAKDTLASRRELLATFERTPQVHSESHLPTPWTSVRNETASAVPTALPTIAPPPPRPRAQRATPLVAIALAGSALGVGAMWFARRPPPRPAAAVIAPVVVAVPPSCPAGMVKIEGGRFFMGSDDDLPLERPAHNVTLSPYCIDVDEVTTGAYQACSDEGRCKRAARTNDWEGISTAQRKAFDPLCNARDPVGRAKHPINCVDWEMASIFCSAHGKRLPTEAEWEFAARGPDGRKYPWGDEDPNPTLLNACGKECVEWGKKSRAEVTAMFDGDDGWPTTAPVGSFPKGASRYGLHDVVGNVWEWVADYYAEYTKDSQVDPKGPAQGAERVIRGGAWNGAYPSWVRPTFRYKDIAEKRSHGIGFRCAGSL
jgi:formylglycine-generating enzyme required for sulfatase activity